jgi:hypothetical protein
VRCLSMCYHDFREYKAALQHAQRRLELTLRMQLYPPRSEQHAHALHGLCLAQRGLKAFPEARAALTEALIIMGELGLRRLGATGACS